MTETNHHSSNRRQFLKRLGIAGSTLGTAGMFFNVPGAFAAELVRTPEQTEGPYYPTTLPLDTDNDLLVINNNITPAVGEITYLSGRVLTPAGEPLRDAYVEIWQADNSGAYIHPQSMGYANRDQNFQGFGRFLTGSTGEYVFRTIKPGLYPGRTRHIHIKVKRSGLAELTSQIYFLGEPQNANDGILRGIQNVEARNSVVVPFVPIPGSTVSALAARFDIVLSGSSITVPLLTITNTTDPARSVAFRTGDSWRLDVRNATPGLPIFLHLWRNNVDLGVSGPYGGTTDSSGAWSLTGSYGAGDLASWQMQAVVGSTTSSQTSAPIALNISNV